MYLNRTMDERRVCVDIDGVVCEYDFPKTVRGYFGVEINPEDLFAYDLADVLGVSSESINMMFQEQVYGVPTFIEGAFETLKDWQSQGYYIAIYTNRLRYMPFFDLVRWLQKYDIPFNNVDEIPKKYIAHIDDSPAKLMATQSKIKLLFTQPWNKRCLNIQGRLQRVNDWNAVKVMLP